VQALENAVLAFCRSHSPALQDTQRSRVL
jgi:hypothetical protein